MAKERKDIGMSRGTTKTGGTGDYGEATKRMNEDKKAEKKTGKDRSTDRIGKISIDRNDPSNLDIAHIES